MTGEINQWIKRHFPISIALRILPEYISDYLRYVRYSGVMGAASNKDTLIASIIAKYHSIEKGLTMPDTRLGFGGNHIESLVEYCNEYIQRFGGDEFQLLQALSILKEYCEFHESRDYKVDHELKSKISSLLASVKHVDASVQNSTSKSDYFRFAQSAFPQFAVSRRSIRNYTSADISTDRIAKAVEIAMHSPSSCNRQGWRVHLFTEHEKIQQILEIQGCTRGFGHLANRLIVITQELSVSLGLYEKPLAYVDGGMFAMSLLYALHADNIGACPLNCSFSSQKANALRKLCNIPASEVFVVMMSCGEIPDEVNIALSTRYPVERFLTVN